MTLSPGSARAFGISLPEDTPQGDRGDVSGLAGQQQHVCGVGDDFVQVGFFPAAIFRTFQMF